MGGISVMGLNNAEYVQGLNANDPSYNDRFAAAASHVRHIKKALKQTFSSVTGAVTVGPTKINLMESRIATLEASMLNFPQIKVKTGRLSINTSSGNYSVTGVGYQPTKLIAMSTGDDTVAGIVSANYSIGFADGTNTYTLSGTTDAWHPTADRTYQSSSYLLDMYGANETSAARVTLVSFDSDGFTVNESLGLWDIDITWMAIQ